jgi:hypothetical protein
MLLDPHSRVHLNAHKAVSLLNAGWERDEKVQTQIIAAMQDAENASNEVMKILNKIVIEKHPEVAMAR